LTISAVAAVTAPFFAVIVAVTGEATAATPIGNDTVYVFGLM